MIGKRSNNTLVQYAIAVLAIVLAVAATLFVRLFFTLNPTPLVLTGVILASWFGGRYPGLLSCVIADFAIDFLFEEPQYEFTLAPVHFVRLTVLIVISLLASSRRAAEEQLTIRERQQAAVAQFGQQALSGKAIGRLLPRAAELVSNTLETEFSSVSQFVPGRNKICFAAGVGWDEGLVGQEFDYEVSGTIARHVLDSDEPIVINDTRRDDRFGYPELIVSHGIRSGVIVKILERDKPYGLLGVFEKHPRKFSIDDVNFLQAIANVIAEATNRLKAEEEINEQRSWLKTTLSSIGDGVIATDLDGNIRFMNPVAENMTGWSDASARGMSLDRVFNIVNEDTRSIVTNPVAKVLSSGKIVGLANHTILLSKDGLEIPIMDSAAPIKDSGEIKGVVLVFSDVSERRQAERARRESEIMHRLVEAQESERHRIARDLHDHLGQKMTALRLQVESLSKLTGDREALDEALENVQESASQIDRDIGFLSWELRPTELDELGLEDALGSFVREWSSQHGIAAEFHANVESGSNHNGRLTQKVETNLYRIVQEGLNNIVKHAQAGQVSVLLHHRKDHIVLVIEDDGVGLDVESTASNNGKPHGLGLVGMRERAALMNGTLEIEGIPGEGTTVLARIPVN